MEVRIHKLQSGRYQTSFFDPNLERRVRKKFQYLKEAKEYEKNILLEYRNSNFVGKSTTPLRDFIPQYQEKNPKASMFTRSPDLYESFVETFGWMAVSEITKRHLAQWLEKIEKEKGYSPRTLVHIKYCFNPFFTHLCSLGVILRNPMSQVKLNRYGHYRNHRIYLSEEEVRTIMTQFKAVSAQEIYPVSHFQLHTAAYIGEVVKLTWNQIDLEKRTVSLPGTGQTSDRVLPLSPKVIELLKTLPRIGDHVFTRADGDAWSVVSFYRKFARIQKKIAVDRHFNNYAFRHTFSYHFLRKGGTLTQLCAMLGHRSIDMTVDMYGSIIDKKSERTTPYDF